MTQRHERMLHPSADITEDERELLDMAIARSSFFVDTTTPKHRNKALLKVMSTKDADLIGEIFEGGIVSEGMLTDEGTRTRDTNITALALLLKHGNSAPEPVIEYATENGKTEEDITAVLTELDSLVDRAIPEYDSRAVFTAISNVNTRTVDLSLKEEAGIHHIAETLQPFTRFSGELALIDTVE